MSRLFIADHRPTKIIVHTIKFATAKDRGSEEKLGELMLVMCPWASGQRASRAGPYKGVKREMLRSVPPRGIKRLPMKPSTTVELAATDTMLGDEEMSGHTSP